ncbi:hypothetical protein C8Q77DRAFT_432082 [Trametes polyzona]|nr:hypothetical protein C8Q77DRAFT_432082 [Trametes polyzona]
MSTLVQQLNNPSNDLRVNHYPYGLRGPFVASPWAAARLGKRIFASKADYLKHVRKDYEPSGRHHPNAVMARMAGRDALVTSEHACAVWDDARNALKDASRYRWAAWGGTDLTAPAYTQTRVEIRKRRSPASAEETGHGVKRCIRSPEDADMALLNAWNYDEQRKAAMEEERASLSKVREEQEVKLENSDSDVVLTFHRLLENPSIVKQEGADTRFAHEVHSGEVVEGPADEGGHSVDIVAHVDDALPTLLKVEPSPSVEVQEKSVEAVIPRLLVEDVSEILFEADSDTSIVSLDRAADANDVVMEDLSDARFAGCDTPHTPFDFVVPKVEDNIVALSAPGQHVPVQVQSSPLVYVREESVEVSIPPLPLEYGAVYVPAVASVISMACSVSAVVEEDIVMGDLAPEVDRVAHEPGRHINLEDEDDVLVSPMLYAPSRSMDFEMAEACVVSQFTVAQDVSMAQADIPAPPALFEVKCEEDDVILADLFLTSAALAIDVALPIVHVQEENDTLFEASAPPSKAPVIDASLRHSLEVAFLKASDSAQERILDAVMVFPPFTEDDAGITAYPTIEPVNDLLPTQPDGHAPEDLVIDNVAMLVDPLASHVPLLPSLEAAFLKASDSIQERFVEAVMTGRLPPTRPSTRSPLRSNTPTSKVPLSSPRSSTSPSTTPIPTLTSPSPTMPTRSPALFNLEMSTSSAKTFR